MSIEHDTFETSFSVARWDFAAAGEVASRIKQILRKLGISSETARRAAVAAYEAEMNLVIHSQGGTIGLKVDSQRILLTCDDSGPGIPDIGLAMQEGYSTAPDEVRDMGFGAGMGLPNIKKCADHFQIESDMERGTRIVVAIQLQQ